jgi:hypothetical protein
VLSQASSTRSAWEVAASDGAFGSLAQGDNGLQGGMAGIQQEAAKEKEYAGEYGQDGETDQAAFKELGSVLNENKNSDH